MNDLISRQAAIDEAKEWIDAVYFEENDKRERKAIECFIGSLKNIPSAQPEIVRCKDCKRKNAIIEIGTGSGKRIEVLCGVFNIITQSDDFCSYGERKDEVD